MVVSGYWHIYYVKVLIKSLIIPGTIILVFVVFNPERYAKYYDFIPKLDTLNELVENTQDTYSNLKSCVYNDILKHSQDIKYQQIFQSHNFTPPNKGGEYKPKLCRPLYKSAIVVPYRDREDQLKIFMNYMHSYLQKQNIHYRIFLVDQQDNGPFNRGKNLNIGAAEAINAGFPCLILHDVDLIPISSGNLYACSKHPRHMSSCVDTFRFQVLYRELFGGVVAINSNVFSQLNGFSNKYDGWGGEDDDLFRRLRANNFTICRFAPELSRYVMLKHKKAKPSENRYNLLKQALQRIKLDGINSLAVQYTVVEKPLYTHIIVT